MNTKVNFHAQWITLNHIHKTSNLLLWICERVPFDGPACIWGAHRAAVSAPRPHTRTWWPPPPTGPRAWPRDDRRTARTWSAPRSASARTASRCPSPRSSTGSAGLRCSSWAPRNQTKIEILKKKKNAKLMTSLWSSGCFKSFSIVLLLALLWHFPSLQLVLEKRQSGFKIQLI